MKTAKKSQIIGKISVYAGIIIFIILWLFPFYIVLTTSGKSIAESISTPENSILSLPRSWKFFSINYKQAIVDTNYFVSFFITLFVTLMSNLFIIFFSSLTAWQLARTKKWYSKVIFYAFLIAMIIPFQSIMFPLLNIAGFLHLKNIYGLIFMYIGFGSSLSVFMIHGFIATIPISLEEVAKVEGYNPIRTFFKIVLPLLKPIITTIVILNTMWLWNDFLLPYLALALGSSSSNEFTLVVSLYKKLNAFQSNTPAFMASLIIIIIPILIYFVIAQKNIMSGITSGSVK
ncbi:carbohydrate ABC transporter permease [Mycoplasmopsis ciconiae]|uniref:Carbohydrate ABC transporter permease n=1 Tax=Mycoplasmopsis ciconiae TaxID=561067 RepID=A0ABU7MKU5_9BACT|nr:carbohydrate ABC transporter permease [Mycoplasmopsis ciconiae]